MAATTNPTNQTERTIFIKPNWINRTTKASLAIGIFGATTAWADDRSRPTYLLANLEVENFEAYMNDYANPLGPILSEAGGEILVVTHEVTQLKGNYVSNLTVVVRFSNAEAANAFYASDAYAALRPARHANTDTTVSALVLAQEFGVPS